MAEIAKIKGYDIRDKKLADATSQSTVAATDAIEMKTTSGDQVYITRDSFVQAMASVLNSNSQSTISQLFGAQANGNYAAINTSNLKSVMNLDGVPVFIKGTLPYHDTQGEWATINNDGDGILYIQITSSRALVSDIIPYYDAFEKTSFGGISGLTVKRETAAGPIKIIAGAMYSGGSYLFMPV